MPEFRAPAFLSCRCHSCCCRLPPSGSVAASPVTTTTTAAGGARTVCSGCVAGPSGEAVFSLSCHPSSHRWSCHHLSHRWSCHPFSHCWSCHLVFDVWWVVAAGDVLTGGEVSVEFIFTEVWVKFRVYTRTRRRERGSCAQRERECKERIKEREVWNLSYQSVYWELLWLSTFTS